MCPRFHDTEHLLDTLTDEQLLMSYCFDRHSMYNLAEQLALDH